MENYIIAKLYTCKITYLLNYILTKLHLLNYTYLENLQTWKITNLKSYKLGNYKLGRILRTVLTHTGHTTAHFNYHGKLGLLLHVWTFGLLPHLGHYIIELL